MKMLLRYSFLALGLALGASTAAHADPSWWQPSPGPTPNPSPSEAPEVDPSLAISGFSLVAGALVVMRSRARK